MDLQVGGKIINLVDLVMRVLKKVHQDREKMIQSGEEAVDQAARQRIM